MRWLAIAGFFAGSLYVLFGRPARPANVVRPTEKKEPPKSTMDTSKLAAVRDKLNTDIDALIALPQPPDQATIDNLTAEATVLDNDVVAALPPPPSSLDFTKFNASLAKLNTDAASFAADPKVTQASIDDLQSQIDTLDGNVVTATV